MSLEQVCKNLITQLCTLFKDALFELSANGKHDEARRKREEKKVQRQRELEARRAARGPMKLGAKKL